MVDESTKLRLLSFGLTSFGIIGAVIYHSYLNRKNRELNDTQIVGKRTARRTPLDEFPETLNTTLLLAARGIMTDRSPVWMMRQAGRYLPEFREIRKSADFFSMCQDPELAAEVTIQPLRRFEELDAVIVFSDILVIPQAMGMEVVMAPKQGPVFPEPLVFPSDVESLMFLDKVSNIPLFLEQKLGYVFDAINLTRQKVDGKVPVIGFSGAPFTLMGYMIEGGGSKAFETTKTWLWNHEQTCHRLLDGLADFIIEYCVMQVMSGAQLIQIFESNAGELSVEQFDKFCFHYLKKIAAGIRSQLEKRKLPLVPLTVFARGANQETILERLEKETVYDTIGLDWTIDPHQARLRIRKKAIQGNLDPCTLFASKETIFAEVEKMLIGFDVGNNASYIANLGHGMIPSHDPEHAKAFIDAVHEISARLRLKK